MGWYKTVKVIAKGIEEIQRCQYIKHADMTFNITQLEYEPSK